MIHLRTSLILGIGGFAIIVIWSTGFIEWAMVSAITLITTLFLVTLGDNKE